MVSVPVVRGCLAFQIGLGLFVASVASAAPPEESPAQSHWDSRQAVPASLEPEAPELKSKATLAVVPKPVLRYSDPPRGGVLASTNVLLDAGVWRLGTEGRPTALVTIEIYQNRDGSRVLAYE